MTVMQFEIEQDTKRNQPNPSARQVWVRHHPEGEFHLVDEVQENRIRLRPVVYNPKDESATLVERNAFWVKRDNLSRKYLFITQVTSRKIRGDK